MADKVYTVRTAVGTYYTSMIEYETFETREYTFIYFVFLLRLKSRRFVRAPLLGEPAV